MFGSSLRAAFHVKRAFATASVAALALLPLVPAHAAQSYSRINKLFNGNTNGGGSGSTIYHSFRIPSIVKASGNVLIAFCEGRVDSDSDFGNINLVYKRSVNNGATWSSLLEIEGTGPGSWTNPTAVYEAPWSGKPLGRVHLFFNWHSGDETGMGTITPGDRKTYYTYSDDDGVTWAAKQDLTATLKPASWAWDAVGPGIGIQKVVAPNIGRLIVPATKRNFHSDNHGATWSYTYMPTSATGNLTGESAIVECVDGALYRNDRATASTWETAKRRWVSYGQIGSFPTPTPQNNLLDPKVAGSLVRYNMNAPDRLMFLNSDSTVDRRHMKVRISYDDGITWPRERWLYVGTPPDNHANVTAAVDAGKGGYSSMIKTNDFHIAALVEMNEGIEVGGPDYQSIDFHKFNLDWITNGAGDP